MVGPPDMKENERQAWIAMLTGLRDTKGWQETLTKQDWTAAFLAGDGFATFLQQEDQRVTTVLKDIRLVQ